MPFHRLSYFPSSTDLSVYSFEQNTKSLLLSSVTQKNASVITACILKDNHHHSQRPGPFPCRLLQAFPPLPTHILEQQREKNPIFPLAHFTLPLAVVFSCSTAKGTLFPFTQLSLQQSKSCISPDPSHVSMYSSVEQPTFETQETLRVFCDLGMIQETIHNHGKESDVMMLSIKTCKINVHALIRQNELFRRKHSWLGEN